MDTNHLLGERVRAIRLKLQLSQEELAYRCGMHTSHIGLLERGERNPSLETLSRLADGLGVSLCELLDFDTEIDIPVFDEYTNKIVALILPLSPSARKQIHTIIKAFVRNIKG